MRHHCCTGSRSLLAGVIFFVLFGVLFAQMGRSVEPPVPRKKPMPGPTDAAVAESSEAFARALFRQLSSKEGNLAVSPVSIETALLVALAGARGDTAAEMARTLQLTEAEAHDVAKLLDDVLARLGKEAAAKPPAATLKLANSIWVQDGFPVKGEFRQLLEQNRRATFDTADFAARTEAARQAINAWANKQTNGKVKDLLPPGILNDQTRMVLANAIYFKGDWAAPFEKDATRDAAFYPAEGQEIKVPTMHQKHSFPYLETDSYQALEMPYKQSDYAMVFWLPKKGHSLDDLERTLTGEPTQATLGNLRPTEVRVSLPKFTVNGSLSLKDLLSDMGMPLAFSPRADFSGLSEEPLMIGQVVHQALVEVDEKGTEAAAATAVVFLPTAALPGQEEPKVFNADHPFVFGIRNRKTGDLLFLGRVVTPKK